jgi:hypothetical protein
MRALTIHETVIMRLVRRVASLTVNGLVMAKYLSMEIDVITNPER